jgi:hypothetical protein
MGRKAANVDANPLELRDEAGTLVYALSRVLHTAIVLCEPRFLADRFRSGDESIRGLQRASPASSGSAFSPCDLDPAVFAPSNPEPFRAYRSGANRFDSQRFGSQRSGSGGPGFPACTSGLAAPCRSGEA